MLFSRLTVEHMCCLPSTMLLQRTRRLQRTKLRLWDFTKTHQDQERFQRPANCKLFPMMKDMNDWIFIETELVQQHNDVAKSQCNKVLNKSINLHIQEIKAAMKPLHFGAISCNNK